VSTESFASTRTCSGSTSALKHPWLRRLRVAGGGYLDGIDLSFSPRGNVICGGPGAGKSTTLALLRYALGLPVPPAKKAAFDSLIAGNLGAGRVHVTLVTAHGAEYELSRAGGEGEPRIDAPASAAGAALDIAKLFPVRIAGAGELELMATDGLARLDLLAGFVWEDAERARDELARVRKELDENSVPLRQLDREIALLERKSGALPAHRRRLEELRKAAGEDPQELEAAKLAKARHERERMMLEAADREVDWLRTELGVFVATVRRKLGEALDPEAQRGGNAEIMTDVGVCLSRAVAAVEELATCARERCEEARGAFERHRRTLGETHGRQDEVYRALLSKHERDAGRAFERMTLEKEVAGLERAKDEREARTLERAQVCAQRERLRARSRALLQELSRLFEGAGDTLSSALGGRVVVKVHPEAERRAYRVLLGDLARGHRFEKKDLDVVAESISPEDLCTQVLAGDATILQDKLGSRAVAIRLVATLLESPRLYELETVDVPHVPTVSLVHGERLKPSDTLSSGQKTLAFFSILLLDRRGPLVIDQPEDNVANRPLAEQMCALLASAQEDMQLLFVTHNGNIPILGRVDRVFELEADGRRGWVAAEGEAREVLVPMENNFEGGRAAFVARKDFYGVR
jgi:hypothetical protein